MLAKTTVEELGHICWMFVIPALPDIGQCLSSQGLACWQICAEALARRCSRPCQGVLND